MHAGGISCVHSHSIPTKDDHPTELTVDRGFHDVTKAYDPRAPVPAKGTGKGSVEDPLSWTFLQRVGLSC